MAAQRKAKITKQASTKSPSPVMQKKAKKAKLAARKEANKSKVRVSRSSKRFEASAKKTKSADNKVKAKGNAPHSARITEIRGPMLSIASRTDFVPKYSEDRKWLLIDAAGQTVGRLASEIAMLLRGKHKPTFTPNNDAGDFVVVVNAEKIVFKSTKNDQKLYQHHSGYIGGLKTRTPATLRAKGQSDEILRMAVKGMVPRSPLGRDQMHKLKIYNTAEHPHVAQNPLAWQVRYSQTRTAK